MQCRDNSYLYVMIIDYNRHQFTSHLENKFTQQVTSNQNFLKDLNKVLALFYFPATKPSCA